MRKQTKSFQTLLITDDYKRDIAQLARDNGVAYGLFFDTSGKLRLERVNPAAQYGYLFRTDRDPV